jgi:hypothetical protein
MIALLLGKQPPTLEDTCSICSSVSTDDAQKYLEDGGDASYVEPATGEWVKYVQLKNGTLFALYHLHDSDVSEEQYDLLMGLIEECCGNLRLYMKELSKFYEHF